jgi:hypothetical protein
MKLTKIILNKFMKSEFNEENFYDLYNKYDLNLGRMISGSKSSYIERYPDHMVVFNGNIITKSRGKIWYGDLDITLDFDNLKNVADELGEDLYILREFDARFENENAGFKYWKKKAVTTILHSNKN